jgi:predicted ATPase/DNA-binding CsgD family transcriptional regulator
MIGSWGGAAVPDATAAREGALLGPRSPLFGRDADALRVRGALERAPLVTLVGAGGSGKTALASAVAPVVAAAAGDLFWWVDLQPVRDDEGVAAAVADALSLLPSGGDAALSAELAATIGDRDVLVVVDNCEHVVAGVVGVLDVLLRRCSGLRVLATSREGLALPSEHILQLGPLAVPAMTDGPVTAGVLERHAATAMFLDRAGLRAGSLRADDRAATQRICARLDGLPLAIELAAARSPVLTPAQIDAALDDRFRLLRNSRDRTAVDRQQTLEASISWSYELLDGDGRRMLRRLSVFPSRFDLAGAAAVGADGDEITAADLVQSLADRSLIVVADRASGRRYRLLESVREFGRARLDAEDERDDTLDAHLAATRSRLRRLGADEAHEGLVLRADPWITEELADVRVAAAWAHETGRPSLSVDLWWAVHLWLGIYYRPREAYDAAVLAMQDDLDDEHRARALTMRALGPVPAVAAGEIAAGDLAAELLWPADGSAPSLALTAFCALLWSTAARTWAFLPGQERVTDAALRLIGLARANRDRWGEVPILATAVMASMSLASLAHPREAYEITAAGAAEAERIGAPDLAAVSHLRAASAAVALGLPVDICTRHVDDGLAMNSVGRLQSGAWLAATSGWSVAYSSGDLEGHRTRLERYAAAAGLAGGQTAAMMQAAIADVHVTDGRPEEAIARCREILPRRDEAAGSFIAFVVRGVLIRALVIVGDLDEAARLAALSESALTDGTFTLVMQVDRLSVATLELARDRPGEALDLLVDAVRLSIEREYVGVIAGLGAHVARALSALDRHHDAARTLGLVDGQLASRGAMLWPAWQAVADAAEAACRRALGDAGFSRALAAGRSWSWADWATWLERGRGSRAVHRPVNGWAALTPTEVEAAGHAAAGLSTAKIGEAMFVSPNTVKTHLKHIYGKLDVHSRVELAGVVDEHNGDGRHGPAGG